MDAKLSDSLTLSLPHSLAPSLPHSFTHSLTHSLSLTITHSLTHSLARSLTLCSSQDHPPAWSYLPVRQTSHGLLERRQITSEPLEIKQVTSLWRDNRLRALGETTGYEPLVCWPECGPGGPDRVKWAGGVNLEKLYFSSYF